MRLTILVGQLKFISIFKNVRYNIIFSLFSSIVLFLLSLNSFIYPTFSVKYFYLSSATIITIYSFLILVFAIFNLKMLPKTLLKINKLFLFPLLLISGSLFVVLERVKYSNFVFSTFHIYPYSYIYICLLSGIIFYISFLKLDTLKERLFHYLTPIAVIFFGYVMLKSESLFSFFTKEGSMLENIQFILIILSSLFSYKIYSLFHKKKNILYSLLFLLLAIAFFFIAMEEISWGQRIFQAETPELLSKINTQNETNLHNLPYFQYKRTYILYMIIGLYGSFSRLIVGKFFSHKKNPLLLFTPSYYFVSYFFYVFLAYAVRCFIEGYYFPQLGRNLTLAPWLEISETFLAIGFFAYIYETFSQLKKCRKSIFSRKI